MTDGTAQPLGDGCVCLAVHADLIPVVREEVLRARPAAGVVEVADCPGAGANILVVAPHELPADDVRRLVTMQRWQWIHLTSAGVDFFETGDVPADTVLTRSANCYAPPVTEYVVMALLHDARPGPSPWAPQPGSAAAGEAGLYRQTLGVAGYGAIGRNAVTVGAALGMEVRLLTRRRREPAELPPGVVNVTRAGDLRDVDHLVLALPLTDATRHLFDQEFFGGCRHGLHLVNVARGALVDHAALARAVETRGVRATLDVTEPEPLPADHPLRHAPGVRISPHVAWHSRTSDWSFVGDFLGNWSRWEKGAALDGLVAVRETGSLR